MANSVKSKQNRLAGSTSPYLLQHKDNPVDWWPWCDEAFERAKKLDMPVFLSIGYSTCHWCHVMAHESFEDSEVAELLNKSFVSIKVDREERPDIDAVYMSVCQALTGSGGWPLTVFLTPEREVFFAGTYFPKRQSVWKTGLIGLLNTVAAQWRADKRLLVDRAAEITESMRGVAEHHGVTSPQPSFSLVNEAAMALARDYDPINGGFGRAPKFPTPHNLMFLLRFHAYTGDAPSLEMVEYTLERMYKGGIFDHIGYGFSRYSTDERWLVPHFEKMLYDNALLAVAYIECSQVTGSGMYLDVAEKILDYVAREMTSPEGGFYSAQDADVDGVEGRFYTFTPFEVEGVLDKTAAADFVSSYSITAQGHLDGRSVPNLLERGNGAALSDAAIETLRDYRKKRAALSTDDKILTSWNALMITAYAKAFRATGNARYLSRATDAYAFIDRHMRSPEGLRISFRDGKSCGSGVLDDYANMCWACLEMYDSTFNLDYLERALSLAQQAIEMFSDPKGGFFLTADDSEKLIFRPKETYDGATPSGNSVLAHCFTLLESLTGEVKWREAADRQLEFCAAAANGYPRAGVFALIPLMRRFYGAQDLVCVVGDDAEAESVALELGGRFAPGLCTLVQTPKNRTRLSKAAPFTEAYKFEGENRFYLCENGSCMQSAKSVGELPLGGKAP